MAPARTLAIAVVVGLLPGALAGPACAQKYKDTSECIQRCSTKWGFPGLMMGNDPWGAVMQVTGKTIDDFYLKVAEACGESQALAASSSSSAADDTQTAAFHGNLGTQAAPSTTSTTATPSSTTTSSRFITSSRATTSSTTSTTKTTTKPKPTTTSTKKLPTTTLQKAPVQTQEFAAPSKNNDGNNDGNKSSSNSGSSNSGSNSGNSNSGNSNSGDSNSGSSSNSNSGGGSGGNGSRASDAEVADYLKGHNTIRAQHGARALTWSNAAAVKAQEWADKCLNRHSGGTLGPLGENLAAGTGDYSILQAVKDWTDESSEYDPNNPQFSHFTQVVWKATTQVGCAEATCPDIFPGFGAAHYYVCEYSVQGNVAGEFAQNVQA